MRVSVCANVRARVSVICDDHFGGSVHLIIL